MVARLVRTTMSARVIRWMMWRIFQILGVVTFMDVSWTSRDGNSGHYEVNQQAWYERKKTMGASQTFSSEAENLRFILDISLVTGTNGSDCDCSTDKTQFLSHGRVTTLHQYGG